VTPQPGFCSRPMGAYCNEQLGDDALAAAIEPIDRWIQG
jgi:hypothetical protein